MNVSSCEPIVCVYAIVTFQVWRVNGDELFLLPVLEQTKLFSGDCYIVQFTYPGNDREENLFYAWLGRRSVMVSMMYHLCLGVFIHLKLKVFITGVSRSV